MNTAENLAPIIEFKNYELHNVETNIISTQREIGYHETEIDEHQQRIQRYQEEINSSKAHIINLRERLQQQERDKALLEFSGNVDDNEVDIDYVIKTLEKSGKFKNFSWKMNRDMFYLMFTVTNIILKPSSFDDRYDIFVLEQADKSGKYENMTEDEIFSDIRDFGIKIPDVSLRLAISTENRQYTFTCETKQPSEYASPYNSDYSTWWPCGYNQHPMPTPHWINPSHPCFGDFNGPLADAMSECDFISALSLIHMFMCQAYTEDAAGKYWPLWINPYIEVPETITDADDIYRYIRQTQQSRRNDFENCNRCPDCDELMDECTCYCGETGDLRDVCCCRDCDPDAYCDDCHEHHDDCYCNEEPDDY